MCKLDELFHTLRTCAHETWSKIKPLRVFAVQVWWRFSVPQGLCRTGTVSALRLKFHAIMTMHANCEVLPHPGTYKKRLKFDCDTFLRRYTEPIPASECRVVCGNALSWLLFRWSFFLQFVPDLRCFVYKQSAVK